MYHIRFCEEADAALLIAPPKVSHFSSPDNASVIRLEARCEIKPVLATLTGLEPAIFGVTGRRVHQLHHRAVLCGFLS